MNKRNGMNNKRNRIIIPAALLFICLCFAPGLLLAETPIMKLSELKVGMEGEGRTIFKGTGIETFRFRILGVVDKFSPGKDLIIVELLDSKVLDEAGIIAGMSGSPVYIGGKLVGAVSYGFPFSKRPIGGVTPIEDIIRTDDHNRPQFSVDIGNIKVEFTKENVLRVRDHLLEALSRKSGFAAGQGMEPIRLIGAARGIDPTALALLAPVFAPAASLQTNNPLDPKKIAESIDKNQFTIAPADAAVVSLIRGDFDYSASGTVTHVDGNKVYLFGHPFFNLGTVDFPLHKADVIAVVPSYQNSFKMTATRHQIGSVIQDRFSAIQAELGRAPLMIPMKVFLENQNRSFNLELADHPLLTPALSGIAMSNIFISEYKAFGFQSLQVKGKIFIENQRNIIIDDMFSGSAAGDELSLLLLAVNYFVMNNKDQPVKIQKIDFTINGSERSRNTAIENVILNKQVFSPGELITVSIFLKNEKGNEPVEKMQIKAPNLKPGAEFFLMVADKESITAFDAKNVKSDYFPNTLTTLIRAINNLRKNNRIYLKLMTADSGFFIKGHEYSNLPSSMSAIFDYHIMEDESSSIRFSTITEYQYEVPAVVTGQKFFKLKIKERSDTDVKQ